MEHSLGSIAHGVRNFSVPWRFLSLDDSGIQIGAAELSHERKSDTCGIVKYDATRIVALGNSREAPESITPLLVIMWNFWRRSMWAA